jgi:hypothetical protein
MITEEEAVRRIQEEDQAAEGVLRQHSAELTFVACVVGAVRVFLEKYSSKMRAVSAATALPPFFLSKLVRTARAVQRLCAGGYGVEAEVLVRAALEALIHLLFITAKDQEERARLYIEFDHVISKNYFDHIGRWPDMRDDEELNRRRDEVMAAYERVKGNYPDHLFWAAKLLPKGRLRAMATDVGLAWYYDFIYWFASNHAHSNARSAQEYVEVSKEGGITYKYGPSARYVTVPLQLVADFLIRGLQRTLAFYGIDAADLLQDLRRRHEEIFCKPPIPDNGPRE